MYKIEKKIEKFFVLYVKDKKQTEDSLKSSKTLQNL